VQAHQLRGEATKRCRRTLLAGEFDRAVEVFKQRAHMPLDRLEAAFGHLRSKDLQGFRIGKTSRQRLSDQCRINPRLLGQRHHFGNHQRIAGHDHLVTGLGHLACPHGAHVRYTLAQGQQHRLRALQVSRFATDHDCQGAGLGARRATGHRRIQPGHATQRSELGSHLTGGGRFEA